MYREDVVAIEAYVEQGPDALVDVIEFVLCTIQAGLSTVKGQRQDIAAVGLESHFLWGKKAEGLLYAKTKAAWLWGKLSYLKEKGRNDPHIIAEATLLLMEVPNLGMVKASFVLQCLGFNTACIDSHNLKRLGLKPSAVKVGYKLSPKAKETKVLAYIKLCQEKGAEYWWDSWCEYVAGNRANRYLTTADAVSAYHVECITL